MHKPGTLGLRPKAKIFGQDLELENSALSSDIWFSSMVIFNFLVEHIKHVYNDYNYSCRGLIF